MQLERPLATECTAETALQAIRCLRAWYSQSVQQVRWRSLAFNDEIAAKKVADSIDLADYSDEKAVEREYRKLAMEAIEGRTSAQDTIAESGVTYIQA